MIKLCSKTIPELSKQIKDYLAEVVEKPSGEYKCVWLPGECGNTSVTFDVERNEAARINKVKIKIGLVSLASGSVHYTVDNKRHKDYQQELKIMSNMIDDRIFTAVNVVMFAESGMTAALQDLFHKQNVECIESELYKVRLRYHRDEDSQRLFVTDLQGNPIYALEEAFTSETGGFLTDARDLKDRIFRITSKIMKLPTFEFPGEPSDAYTEEAS